MGCLLRGVDPAAAPAVLDGFEGLIHPLQEEAYAAAPEDALARIATSDEQGGPILAAALTLNYPIWTEDQDFFGAGVPTWTTDRVHGQHRLVRRPRNPPCCCRPNDPQPQRRLDERIPLDRRRRTQLSSHGEVWS